MGRPRKEKNQSASRYRHYFNPKNWKWVPTPYGEAAQIEVKGARWVRVIKLKDGWRWIVYGPNKATLASESGYATVFDARAGGWLEGLKQPDQPEPT